MPARAKIDFVLRSERCVFRRERGEGRGEGWERERDDWNRMEMYLVQT